MKSILLLILWSISFCYCADALTPAPSAAPPTLLETLTPSNRQVNPASSALFPFSTRLFQTPLSIRYFLFYAIARYEGLAACHARALSFFGTRDDIPPHLCTPLAQITIVHYIFQKLNKVNFPSEASEHAAFLRSAGLTPDSSSSDLSTEIGWANMVAARANKYFSADGWNSLGDINAEVFRRPYSDYSNYRPVNPPGKPASKLPKPLRWQPLVEQVDNSPGEYVFQQHITPFLDQAKPLVLTPADMRTRRTESPYNTPNMKRILSRKDSRKMEGLMDNYFRISRKLTPAQRFLAFYWNDKAISVGTFLGIYTRLFRFDDFTRWGLFLGEMIAQHDSILVVWKEKRIHDLVRPTTIIRKLRAGRRVRAYFGIDGGVQDMKVEEYEPLLVTQPHSEFPSASAAICQATFDYVDIVLKKQLGQNVTLPPITVPASISLIPVMGNFSVTFKSLAEANRSCGKSRLWAGVHFPAAVKAGWQAAAGIGSRASDQIMALMSGRVPANCARCL